LIKGVVIPTITPMNEDNSIDDASLVNYTRFLLEAGVDPLYPNGTNGESLLLTKAEREHVAEIMARENNHCLPLYVQCGSMTTAETVSHSKHAVKIGADGIGIMSPAFFPMDDKALFLYYSDVISKLPEEFPVYIYNIPGCTTNDIKPALLKSLMGEFANIVGIKFSSSNLMRLEDYLEVSGRKPELLIGCDSLFFQCLVSGGAAKTQKKIVETDRKMAGIPGIPALKTLLKLRGIIRTDVCRMPLRPLTTEEKLTLEEIYSVYCKEERIYE